MVTPTLLGALLVASTWTAVGPPGGDVRSLAVDPRAPGVVYLGTANSTLYRSDDAGATWRRPEPGFDVPGMSLDDLVVTPDGRLLVGYWEISGGGGGVALSDDGGAHFRILDGVAGRAVRALALAPSSPGVLAVGTPTGVLVSRDAGATWSEASPPGHPGLSNVGSLAFDPADSRTLYAGTWHLAWKTTDAGNHWEPIHDGMIADSDVMTLTVDPRQPRRVFATACSGIYRSSNAGRRWSRISGIPWSARRTRAFVSRGDSLYAGTVEGIWRSDDDGSSWRAVTSPDVVVNALVGLPDGGVLAGTDGAGVLRSTDGERFTASNTGFAERFVTGLAVGLGGEVLAAVVGDRSHSGVFAADWGAGRWQRLAPGLEGREVLALAAGPPLLAGTDDGLFRNEPGVGWRRLATVVAGRERHPRITGLVTAGTTIVAATDQGLLRSTDTGTSWSAPGLGLGGAVTAVASGPDGWLAATTLGVFRSDDGAASWQRISSGPPGTLRHLTPVSGDTAWLGATDRGLFRSGDGGRGWVPTSLRDARITGLAVAADGRTVFAADFSHAGLFRSADGGRVFEPVAVDGLGLGRAWAVAIDPGSGRVLVSSPVGGVHVLSRPAPTAAAGSAARD